MDQWTSKELIRKTVNSHQKDNGKRDDNTTTSSHRQVTTSAGGCGIFSNTHGDDRRAKFQSMFRAASGAAARGDSRALYKIVNQAAGEAPEPHKELRDKFGVCSKTPLTLQVGG